MMAAFLAGGGCRSAGLHAAHRQSAERLCALEPTAIGGRLIAARVCLQDCQVDFPQRMATDSGSTLDQIEGDAATSAD